MRLFRLFPIYAFMAAAIVATATSCIEDGFTTSPSDQPAFSVDTLKMGTVFTGEGTPTHSFKVYNRHSKGITISSIAFRNEDDASMFRLNVDGIPGRSFHDVEIRANDSIFVLVEATVPSSGGATAAVKHDAPIDFITNGVSSEVVLCIYGQDFLPMHAERISADRILSSGQPYRVFDSLVVDPGATLTLAAGTRMHFHDGAMLRVYGTLRCEGTPQAPVTMEGDRFGQVVGRIPYEIMSNQWYGVELRPTSGNHYMSHTVIKNTTDGVILAGDRSRYPGGPSLTMLNCRLRNSGTNVLWADSANVEAVGCEFAEAASGLVVLIGGSHTLNHCTLANNYLFSAIEGAALTLAGDDIKASVTNSIIYGLGNDVYPGDLKGKNVAIRHSIIRAEGTDDDNFIDIMWGVDPLYRTVRADYFFDYRLLEDSPARGAANPALTLPQAAADFYGLPRSDTPDLGAYVYAPDPAESGQ